MKLNKIALLGVMMSLLLFGGCKQLSGSSVTSTPEYTASSVTPTITFVSTLTPIPTYTSIPSPTTPIIIPTLPIEDANKRFLELLANNGGCHLPCLWGITPGKSSYNEAQSILEPLSSLSDFTDLFPSPGDISPAYTKGNFVLYTRIAFLYPESGIVNSIAFNAEAHKNIPGGYEDVFDSNFFGEKVSAYTLAHVLTEQGVPSSVMVETAGGPLTRGGTGGFDILLLYPDQGILVNYKTQMHLIGSNVRGCPLNAYVQMELYPSGQPDSFFEGLKQTDWAVKMTGYKPLEETTSMSVQEFYETFREATNKCIETPAKLWPTPEP